MPRLYAYNQGMSSRLIMGLRRLSFSKGRKKHSANCFKLYAANYQELPQVLKLI